MGETGLHVQELAVTLLTLVEHFRDEPDVYVGGNMLLYYVEGDPKKRVSPDVFMVRGIPREPLRDSYKVWVEGKAPDVVIELSSRKTRRIDLYDKRELYERLGVREYILFDPRAEYLKPPLQGFRLNARGRYDPIPPEPDGSLLSIGLELRLQKEERILRLVDPRTGEKLLRGIEQAVRMEAMEGLVREAEAQAQEAEAQAREAEARLERERLARAEVESELARLRAELEVARKE